MMAWVGFERYGRVEDAQRLAYRWLYMMTTAFVDFNGVVPEKVCHSIFLFLEHVAVDAHTRRFLTV